MPRLERGRFVEVDGSPRWEFGLGWWSVEDRTVLVESGRWWVIGILGARPGIGQVSGDRLAPGVVSPSQWTVPHDFMRMTHTGERKLTCEYRTGHPRR